MPKREKHSLIDLMSQPQPEAGQVEEAVKRIHQVKKEKTVRVTVDTPESLHKELKRLIIDESTDLKSFFLQAAMEKMERLRKS